jgi:hypothetical protein
MEKLKKGIEKNKTEKQSKQSEFHSFDLEPKKKVYKRILFNNIDYKLGDTIQFRETEKTSVVGKLIKIISEGGNPSHPKWPMIEVQWYYKKNDLDLKKLGLT